MSSLMFICNIENVILNKAILYSVKIKRMRSTVFIIGLLIIMGSCKTSLNISDVEAQNIPVASTELSADSSIILMVMPYKLNLESDMSKVISISDEELVAEKPESKLTNLMADLILQSGVAYCKMNYKNFKPDMSFVNYGGLRSSLPKGQITVGDIYELMPFENTMVLLKVDGETMSEFVSQIASRGGDGVAGIRLRINDDSIGTLLVGGKPIDRSKDFWIVTNDYVAAGGDNMSMLLDRKQFISTGLKIRDVVIDSLNEQFKRGKRIQVELDGRMYYE